MLLKSDSVSFAVIKLLKMHNPDNPYLSEFVFMIQVSSDLINWSDTDMVFPDLPSACDFARSKSKGMFWNSLRIVRV